MNPQDAVVISRNSVAAAMVKLQPQMPNEFVLAKLPDMAAALMEYPKLKVKIFKVAVLLSPNQEVSRSFINYRKLSILLSS